MKRKTNVRTASSISRRLSRSLRSTPLLSSRNLPIPFASLGRAIDLNRSSRPLRSSSPKSRASAAHSVSHPLDFNESGASMPRYGLSFWLSSRASISTHRAVAEPDVGFA